MKALTKQISQMKTLSFLENENENEKTVFIIKI